MNQVQQDISKPSILVVDDTPDNLRLLMKILAEHGYEVRLAYTGDLALQSVQSIPPDLILLDIKMPGMNGHEMCEQLKADPQTRDIPIIFISALNSTDDKVRGFEAGGIDYITKPFQVKEVLARVKTHLTVRHLRQSLAKQNEHLQKEVRERKLAEERTMKMWQRLEFLLNASPTGIYACEPDSHFDTTFMSENVKSILGYEAYDFIAEADFWRTHIHPDDREAVESSLERLHACDRCMTEYRFLHQDGQYRWIKDERILRRNEQGEPTEIIGSLSDISQRKRDENTLQQRNRELSLVNRVNQMFSSTLELEKVLRITLEEIQRLLELVSVSIWLLSPETDELVCMQATGSGSEKLVQYRLEPGQGILGWVAEHGESQLIGDAWIDERYADEVNDYTGIGIRSILALPLRVQGATIGVLSLMDPAVSRFSRDEQTLLEPIAGAAAIAIDNARLFTTAQQEIAERWKAEAELRSLHKVFKEKNRQLQEANATKDKFFSIISHDLRSPFNTLQGFTQLLSEHYDSHSEEKRKEYVTRIHRSTERLHDLLENLLTWSRLQREAMTYEPEFIDFWDLVDDNFVLFSSKAEEKQITLKNRVDEDLQVYADANMADTTLRNLLSNALKFTEAGGEIRVSANLQEQHVEITVSDTGQGIAEDDLSQLFRTDTQFTRPGTSGEAGTGLGLNLCKEFAEKNGGTIWVESALGEGTRFSFTLPKQALGESSSSAASIKKVELFSETQEQAR